MGSSAAGSSTTTAPAPPGSQDSAPNPDLAPPLASNGAITGTIALGAGSAADSAVSSPATATLGGVSVNLCSDPSYATAFGVKANLDLEQRGMSRPVTGCCAGAYQHVGQPSAPVNPAAEAGNTPVALSWSAPSSNGDSAVTGYDVDEGTVSGSRSTRRRRPRGPGGPTAAAGRPCGGTPRQVPEARSEQ